MTLVFETPGETGRRKSSLDTDVVDGEFLELVPNKMIQQRFRLKDPSFAGMMVMKWTLTPDPAGTDVALAAENVLAGISPRDHEIGMQSSLANLAAFIE